MTAVDGGAPAGWVKLSDRGILSKCQIRARSDLPGAVPAAEAARGDGICFSLRGILDQPVGQLPKALGVHLVA